MKFKGLQKKKRGGFTLVEMVIVITIIGILSGLGFMKFGKVQETSRKNADYIAAANLATAANLYINDNLDNIIYDDQNIAKIDILKLKEKGYISSIPKSQSQGQDFEIVMKKIEDEGTLIREDLLVKSNDVIFYPKIDKEISPDDNTK